MIGRTGWSSCSAVMAAVFAQTMTASPRELIKAARPLTSGEVAAVVQAAQRAIVGETFRLSARPGGPGAEFLMGRNGRPRIFRMGGGMAGGIVGGAGGVTTEWRDYIVREREFTGRPARRCSGGSEPGELVIEYEHSQNANAWTASARAIPPPGLGIGYNPVFDILRGATPLESGELRKFGEHTARALFAAWTPPPHASRAETTGDPLPNMPPLVNRLPKDDTQTLWLDTESLRPLRWEASGPDSYDYQLTFNYERLDLRRPAGVKAPDCIR